MTIYNPKHSVHRAHFIKLLSNCRTYSSLIAIASMDFLKQDKKFFFLNNKPIDELNFLTAEYHNEVFNHPDYDKYKSENKAYGVSSI